MLQLPVDMLVCILTIMSLLYYTTVMSGDGAAAHVRAVLEEAAVALKEQYPAMCKTSTRCRPPHINLDVLRDEIFQVKGQLTIHKY
jgi:hypothetical protein